MSPARRTLELVCFLRVTLMDLVDIVLSQLEKRVSELWSGARQTAERQQNERNQTAWLAVQAIHETLHNPDISDRRARTAACAIIDPLIERRPPPRAALTREALTSEPKIRPLLRALMSGRRTKGSTTRPWACPGRRINFWPISRSRFNLA